MLATCQVLHDILTVYALSSFYRVSLFVQDYQFSKDSSTALILNLYTLLFHPAAELEKIFIVV